MNSKFNNSNSILSLSTDNLSANSAVTLFLRSRGSGRRRQRAEWGSAKWRYRGAHTIEARSLSGKPIQRLHFLLDTHFWAFGPHDLVQPLLLFARLNSLSSPFLLTTGHVLFFRCLLPSSATLFIFKKFLKYLLAMLIIQKFEKLFICILL